MHCTYQAELRRTNPREAREWTCAGSDRCGCKKPR